MAGSVSKNCSDQEFIKLFREIGPNANAKQFGILLRGVFDRRKRLEKKYDITLTPKNLHKQPKIASELKELKLTNYDRPQHTAWEIEDGEVFVASDLHIWPGPQSMMLKAFKSLIAERKPRGIILNGDVLDFCAISRFPPPGWERLPTVQEEIEAAHEHLSEIVNAAGRQCRLRCWTLGNHDARFEARLAASAPEYAKVHGIHLHDHFPAWARAMQVWINDDVVIKHNWKGGVNAVLNNVKESGKSMITGHLHSGYVRPYTDFNGTRWGGDMGMVADVYGPQFEYVNGNPRNWLQSFGVLKFFRRKLLMPDLVIRYDAKHVQFRGEVIKVA